MSTKIRINVKSPVLSSSMTKPHVSSKIPSNYIKVNVMNLDHIIMSSNKCLSSLIDSKMIRKQFNFPDLPSKLDIKPFLYANHTYFIHPPTGYLFESANPTQPIGRFTEKPTPEGYLPDRKIEWYLYYELDIDN